MRLTGVIAVLIMLIAVIGHFWLIPAKFRYEIKRSLKRFWDGQVDIEDIEVNYFGPVYLSKVSFFDKTGQERLRTGRVKMIFTEWPGVHPVATEIEIEKLNLRISSPVNRIAFPVADPSRRPPGSKKRFNIRKFTVKNADITAFAEQGSLRIYKNLYLLVNKEGRIYDFLLRRPSSVPSESLLVKGKIDSGNFETKLSFKMKHTVKKLEMSLIFAALNVREFSAGGHLAADLTMTGCLKQPAGLKANGIIELDKWTVGKNNKTIANNLKTKADVKEGRFDFDNITAAVFDGNAVGSLYIESRPNSQAIFGGSVLIQGMDFVEMTSVLGGPGRRATRGLVAFSYSFTGEGADLQNIVGRGQIFLDDADITVIPIVPYIFRFIGLSQFNPLEMSDAGCTFTTAGPVVTVETAHIDNLFAALEAEPCGSINLQTKVINMYVIALPIKQIDAIVSRIRILNIFVNLKNKLVRFRIHGPWSDTPAKLITKEPITDVTKATVGFFRDVIETGGWITQPIRKGFGVFPEPEDGNRPNN